MSFLYNVIYSQLLENTTASTLLSQSSPLTNNETQYGITEYMIHQNTVYSELQASGFLIPSLILQLVGVYANLIIIIFLKKTSHFSSIFRKCIYAEGIFLSSIFISLMFHYYPSFSKNLFCDFSLTGFRLSGNVSRS